MILGMLWYEWLVLFLFIRGAVAIIIDIAQAWCWAFTKSARTSPLKNGRTLAPPQLQPRLWPWVRREK